MGKETESIYQAEIKRVKGPKREALEMAREHGRVSPETIGILPREKLVDLMRWWRIWAVTLMSLHKGEWGGGQAAEYLLEVRDVFQTYYDHPLVIRAAEEMRTDPEGHEYQMAAEMSRDKGRYCLYVASLTGNSVFLNQAAGHFDKAVREAEQGTSAWAVATMEKEVTNRRLGKGVDWETFTLAYQTAVALSPQAGGWDRMVAVSWWYVKEALLAGRREELRSGLENLEKASQERGINWILQCPLKDLVSSLLGISRRATARGIPSDRFQT